jgi:hypothetical protein
MHLSLTKEHYITIVGDKGQAMQVSIQEAIGERTIFDWFGNEHLVSVSKAPALESVLSTTAASGEFVSFGETHSFYARAPKSAEWKRTPITDLTNDMFLVQLPQKKIEVADEVFESFDLDDKHLYIVPQQASDLSTLMRKAAWSGITVNRHKTELRIELEKLRPACFASKLINGALTYRLKDALSSLISSGIVSMPGTFCDEYVTEVQRKKVLMEGFTVFNSTSVLPVRKISDKMSEVYHVDFLGNSNIPVELTWFHS